MKNLTSLLATAVLASAAITPSALALTVNMEEGRFRGTGGGGEFVAITTPETFLDGYSDKAKQVVTANNGDQVTGFGTFCLERSERINFKDTYTGTLNQRAMLGGTDLHDPVGAGPAGDPISKATAYLYSQFARGVLTGYAYGDGTDGYSPAEVTARKATSNLLQDAIWYFEDELTLANPSANTFIAAALSAFADPFAASDGLFNVSAINMYSGSAHRQDVLVYTPPSLPDAGATLGMLGGSLLGVAALRRRKN